MKTRITSFITQRKKLSKEFTLLIIQKKSKRSHGSLSQENRCSLSQINFATQELLIQDLGVSKWSMFSRISYLHNSTVQSISMIEHWWRSMRMQIKLEVMKRFHCYAHVWIHWDKLQFSVETIKGLFTSSIFQNLKSFIHSMWAMIRKLSTLLQMDSIASLLLMMDKWQFMTFKMISYNLLKLKNLLKEKQQIFLRRQSEILRRFYLKIRELFIIQSQAKLIIQSISLESWVWEHLVL